jgi:hypothetical protein
MGTDTPIFITLSFILFGIFVFAYLYEGTTSTSTIHLIFPPPFAYSAVSICNSSIGISPTEHNITSFLGNVGSVLQDGTGTSGSSDWSCGFQTLIFYVSIPVRLIIYVIELIGSLVINIFVLLAVAIGAFGKLPILFNILFVMPLSLVWIYMIVRLFRGI